MESTGTGRKALVKYTPPQKRTKSLPNYATWSTVVQNQHFSSRTPLDLYSLILSFLFLGKTEFNENRGGHTQKRCVLCRSKNIRRQTIHFCRTCPDKPGLCYPECFDLYHTNLSDRSNQF